MLPIQGVMHNIKKIYIFIYLYIIYNISDYVYLQDNAFVDWLILANAYVSSMVYHKRLVSHR